MNHVQGCVSEIMKHARQSNVPIVVDGVCNLQVYAWLGSDLYLIILFPTCSLYSMATGLAFQLTIWVFSRMDFFLLQTASILLVVIP